MAEKREVVIVSAVRTAIGTFGGTLKDFSSSQLGTVAVKEAIARASRSTQAWSRNPAR